MLHFIINRKSKTGNGKKVWLEVKEYLKEHDIPYVAHVTESQGHAKKIAKELSQFPDEIVRIVVIGGDGTVNETVNGIQDFEKVRFGVIPSGSGNDFVRGLGLKGSPVDHLKRIVESKEDQVIDLGCVTRLKKETNEKLESRLFAISSGFGMDAMVGTRNNDSRIKKVLNKVGLGKLSYVLLTIYTLFSMETFSLKANFAGEEKEWKKTIFIASMNCSAEGGGVQMAPRSSFRDGKISFCCIHGIPKFLCFFLLPLLVIGKHEGIKGIEMIDCEKCEMHTDLPAIVHTDGELFGEETDIEVSCKAAKLHIMM